LAEELIGSVSHYFAKPQVGVVKLTAGIKVGDTLRFSGHGAEFRQTVTSMQLDHVPVETASPGTEVAIKVEQRVREGTHVYRITP
jgi:translation initiation factor IF-2